MRFWKHSILAVCLLTLAVMIWLPLATGAPSATQARTDYRAVTPPAGAEADMKYYHSLLERIHNGGNLTEAEKAQYVELDRRFGIRRDSGNALDNQGGPDAFGYIYMDNVAPDTATYNWIELRGDDAATWLDGTNWTSHDDGNYTSQVAIGWDFPFYGQTYNQFWVMTNGWISFSVDPYPWDYGGCMPLWNNGPAIVPFDFDLHIDRGGMPDGANVVGYRNFGDHFVITFDSIGYYNEWDCPGLSLTFQAILYNDGKIKFQYRDLNMGAIDICMNAGTVGIQQNGGAESWLEYRCNGTERMLADERAIWFIRAQGVPLPATNLQGSALDHDVTLTWTDPTLDTQGNPLTLDNVQVWFGPVDTGELVGTVNAGVQTFTHVNAPDGIHTYTVRPYNAPYFGTPTPVDVLVGNPTYNEGFEGDAGMWVATPETGGWTLGTPTIGPGGAHGGVDVWGVGLNEIYPSNACFYLDLDLGLAIESPAASVEFWLWYSTENFWDGLNFKISVDEGQTWELVTPEDGYPNPSLSGENACIPAEQAWSGWMAQWQYVVLPIGQWVGQTPIFRISFGSDPIINITGAYIDDMLIWGLEPPVGAPVSGTVVLDGGSGDVTQVSLRSNGLGNPTTNPLADGTYVLNDVMVGQRRITVSLPNYETQIIPLTVPEGGVTNFNISLRRSPPPPPTNLTIVSYDTANGIVNLNWDNSTDPLVDVYRVYRRISEDDEWQPGPLYPTSDGVYTLPAVGRWELAVAAVDTNASTPVDSDPSNAVSVLFGLLPPHHLSGNGNFDDHIHLSWLRPDAPPEFELFYDNGENSPGIVGIGWELDQPPFGWLVARYQGNDTVKVTRLKTWITDFATPGDQFQVGVFADNFGIPTFEPLGVIDAVQEEPFNEWVEFPLDTLTFPDGVFYVGIRQMTPNRVSIGGDNVSPMPTNTFFYSYDGFSWTPYEPNLMVIPMQRCFAIGEFGEELALAPAPATGTPVESSAWANIISRPTTAPARMTDEKPARDAASIGRISAWHSPMPDLERQNANRLITAVNGPITPNAEAYNDPRRRSALDEVLDYYIVYRDNVDIAHPDSGVTTYDDMVAEGIAYTYRVTARYDNGVESGPSGSVTKMAMMAPGAPTAVDGLPVNPVSIRIFWNDPAVNADGSPCVDLAAVNVYRDGVLLGSVAAGVEEYIDTPPQPNQTYVWTVRGVDEVPNEGQAESFTGSVISPWTIGDYDWVDITAEGTQVTICDDCASGMVDIGFDFPYYGQTYDQVNITSNGWISFTWFDMWASTWLPCMPDFGTPNATIAVFATDLNPGNGGAVRYYHDTVEERFIVSWDQVPHFPNNGSYTFQLILTPDGGVHFNYQAMSDNNCTVGVENASGTAGISLWCNLSGEFPPEAATGIDFWGAPPVYTTVTGTVALDGGTGVLTNVLIAANGVSRPDTTPDVAGNYFLDNVVVGNRRIIASLAGYDSDTNLVAVPEGGMTGVNFVLRRSAPPVTAGLTASINSGNGNVTLNWNDSPDLLVDGYKVYRKLHSTPNWTLLHTIVGRTNSQDTDNLVTQGAYDYTVTAYDENVLPPAIESPLCPPVLVIAGHMAAQQLTADGNYDSQIRLTWNSPSEPPQFIASYDNGRNSPTVDGIGWWGALPEFGWLVSRFESQGPLTVTGMQAAFTRFARAGAPIQVGIFADNNGQPAFQPLAVLNATIETRNGYQEFTLAQPVTIENGVFYAGVRQLTDHSVCLGGDEESPFLANTFFYSRDGSAWSAFEEHMAAVPMLRAVMTGAISESADEAKANSAPVRRTAVAKSFAQTHASTKLAASKAGGTGKAATASVTSGEPGKEVPVPEVTDAATKPGLSAADLRRIDMRLASALTTPKPNLMIVSTDDRGHGTLDDIVRFRIYRDTALYDSVAGTVTTYMDDGTPTDPMAENVPHSYYVTVVYNDNVASAPSNTLTNVRCNMAPDVPTGLGLAPVGSTQMRVSWNDPQVNADGSPCNDLASVRVFRNGALIGTVNAGVEQYTDTPPDANEIYTWSVRGLDEVPNIGAEATASGSVLSPWQQVEYEWVDISQVGTPMTPCDNCAEGPYPLGFDFPYYGQTYNQVSITTNGWLSLTWNQTWATAWLPCFPDTWEPNATIAFFAADMNSSAGGQILYHSAGDEFILSYIGVPRFWNTGSFSFQVILDDNGGIRMNYQAVEDNFCVISVENESGTDGIGLWCQGAGEWAPSNETAVQFWGGPSSALTGWVHAFGTNQPIANARVWITGLPDTLTTDATGVYNYEAEPGTYTVHYEHPTFCDSILTGVVLIDDEATVRNVLLRAPQADFDVTSITLETWPGHNVSQLFHITNPSGQCPLDWAITDTSAWLSANPSSGTLNPNQQVEVTALANVQALPPNTEWHSALRLTYNATGSPHLIPVDLLVAGDLEGPGASLPATYALYQNYPNPFNAQTMLRFDVPQASRVQVVIYNVTGQEVARPVDRVYEAGRHQFSFDAGSLPSGMYLVQMQAGSFKSLNKMMLLK